MAELPFTLQVVTKGNIILTVPNFVSETFEDLITFDGTTYRDEIDQTTLGRSIELSQRESVTTIIDKEGIYSAVYDPGEGTPSATGDVTLVGTAVTPTLVASDTAYFEVPKDKEYITTPQQNGDGYFDEHDPLTHTPPREWPKKRTRIRWWDGVSYLFPVTLVSGNTTVTVSDTENFSIGQTIAGAGLVIDTIIISITNGTQMVVSQAPTVSATNTVVVSAGNCVGWTWADELRSLTSGSVRRL